MTPRAALTWGIAPGLRARLPRYAAWIAYSSILGSLLAAWLGQMLRVGSIARQLPRLDFMGSYLGGSLLVQGRRAQLFDLTTQMALQQRLTAPDPVVIWQVFCYPGWNALLFALIAWLPYAAAFGLWTAFNLSTVALLLPRLLRAVAPAIAERRLLLLAALAWAPLAVTVEQGQLSILIWLGVTAALLALRGGRERTAGVWLVLALVKPPVILALLLALLVERRWRVLQGFVGAATALGVTSLFILGNWIPSYLSLLGEYVRQGAALGDIPASMENWRGLVYHLLGTDAGPLAGGLVTGLTALSFGLVILLCWPRRGRSAPSWEVRYATVLLVGLLADPHFYWHDAMIALTAGLLLWRATVGADPRLRVVRALLAAGPLVARLPYASVAIPFVQPAAWYLVAVLLAVAWAWPVLTYASGPVPDAESRRFGLKFRGREPHWIPGP